MAGRFTCGAVAASLQCRAMWDSYIALGDSFTEGLDDPRESGKFRGWADRLAAALHERNPSLQYANLAVRGRTTEAIEREQVPVAVSQSPQLVSIASGVNDLLRASWDPARTFAAMDRSLAALRAAGADVLVVAFGDPRQRKAIGRLRPRFEVLNRGTVMLAREHGCHLLDFWKLADYDSDAFWSEDRLHLSALGHEVSAAAALEVLGLADGTWREAYAVSPAAPTRPAQAVATATWAVRHALPWAVRRLRGQSSGDGITAKRPVLASVAEYPLD